jgi:hypothetical protein
MIPYTIKFILGKDEMRFESNEKPFKGELYTIQNADTTLVEVRVKDVTKIIARTKGSSATIEYHCVVEKHEESVNVIGFGKRS